MFNRVFLIGRLGRDPELKETKSATICTFSLVTSENFTDKNGEKIEKTEWHNVVTFGKTAENCAKYLEKGKIAFIEGKITTRTWEDQDGNKHGKTEIQASNVTFLSPKEEAKAPQRMTKESSIGIDPHDDVPF